MATIFQEAESVLVWLGPSTFSLKQTLRFLDDVRLSGDDQEFWGQSLLENEGGRLCFKESFKEFLNLEYWHRTWIVQELAVAEKIALFCGPDRMDGTVLEALFSQTIWESPRLHAYSEWLASSVDPFEHLVDLWNTRHSLRNRQPMDPLSLLFRLRIGKTTLQLDRVYALLGLAFDQRSFVAEPD